MSNRSSLMQDVRARYLAVAPEEDAGRQRIIVPATDALENILFLLTHVRRDFQWERREVVAVG